MAYFIWKELRKLWTSVFSPWSHPYLSVSSFVRNFVSFLKICSLLSLPPPPPPFIRTSQPAVAAAAAATQCSFSSLGMLGGGKLLPAYSCSTFFFARTRNGHIWIYVATNQRNDEHVVASSLAIQHSVPRERWFPFKSIPNDDATGTPEKKFVGFC